MIGKDYIPRKDAEFNKWLRNISQKLPNIATAIGLPQSLVDELVAAYTDWKDAYKSHQKAHNVARGATETKNKKLVNAKSVARLIIGMLQVNPKLTDVQREVLDITVPDRIRTPLSEQIVLTEPPPRVKVVCTSPKQVRIDWYPTPVGTDSGAKPKGIDGVAIWYAEGGIPTDDAEWRFLALDTNSPYIHNVGNDKTVTLAYKAQWFDRRKRMGPFGNPVTVAVTG